MFKQLSIAGAALAMGLTALAPTAADAQRYYGDRYSYDRGYYNDYGPHYRGNSYRRDRNRCDNTAGTVIGAIAGGLLGRTVDTRGDRSVGTIGGALLGGLAGREVARSDNPGYCRRR